MKQPKRRYVVVFSDMEFVEVRGPYSLDSAKLVARNVNPFPHVENDEVKTTIYRLVEVRGKRERKR